MSYEDLIKNLQRDYLMGLPEKIKEIERQIRAGDSDNVRESFHKLKGTGATYGLPEVTELAALVESICLVKPAKSIPAADEALPVLHDIYVCKTQKGTYNLSDDPRVSSLRKVLQT